MRTGELAGGIVLLVLGTFMAAAGFTTSARGISVYLYRSLFYFGVMFFLVGLVLLRSGAVGKRPGPAAAHQSVVQTVQYRQQARDWPLTSQGSAINPPASYDMPPPVDPPAHGRKPTLGTRAQFTGSFCTKCGAPLPAGSAFCGACGTKVGS